MIAAGLILVLLPLSSSALEMVKTTASVEGRPGDRVTLGCTPSDYPDACAFTRYTIYLLKATPHISNFLKA